MNESLAIAHRGEEEVVVVKPAGLSTEGAPDAALERVRRDCGWPHARVPHRLDRVTRGFLLVSRDAASAAMHSEQLRQRRWTKCYIARLHAPADPKSLLGLHKRYLKREGRVATLVRSGGDPAWMEIMAVASTPHHAGQIHVAIRLLTGRFHQIRVMCKDLGAPLVGDELYGSDASEHSMYLEHALLEFPLRDGRVIRLYNPHDPEREAVAESILLAVSAAVSAAGLAPIWPSASGETSAST